MAKILIAADFVPMDRVASLVEKECYREIFEEIIRYTSDADYSIVNLEAPVVKGEYLNPIKKCGPALKCNSNAIKALKYAGFNMVTLANNHFYDYGDEAVKNTLTICQNDNIAYVGGGENIEEASQTKFFEAKELKIAIINCCEHESSIATDCTGGSNPLDPIKQYYAIQEAKNIFDKVIVIVHGGHEGYQLPSPRMKKTYRFFIDAGADVVLNHHQHCYSGYEIYKQKPIFYGLGNFSFNRDNKRNILWNEGYMVMLDFKINDIEFDLIPYIQGKDKAGIKILKDKSQFENSINKLNSIIANDQLLNNNHKKWMKQTSKIYKYSLEPYQGHFLFSLYKRGLLPSFITNYKKLRIRNFCECEAHLERLINSLK